VRRLGERVRAEHQGLRFFGLGSLRAHSIFVGPQSTFGARSRRVYE
jgi:hypothetical protein